MNRSRLYVLGACGVVVVLATLLAVRLLGREERDAPAKPVVPLARYDEPAPPAKVPPPVAAAGLKIPCWGCPVEGKSWPTTFRTDLDILAPLGDGAGNAALWLKDFSKAEGSRSEEAEKAAKRRVEGPPEIGKVLPPDDPLLLEAEPWADQAVMRFYPEILPLEGFATPIPNLLLSLTFAKSWVARGLANPDSPTALDDCRRAIRWGRLLRQDDVTVIQDLIGLACIRIGAQGLYDLASRRGDMPLMLASAIVVGEHGPQRLRTMELIRIRGDAVVISGEDRAGDGRLDVLVDRARNAPDRRFRGEAVLQLAIVRQEGTRAQRQRAEETLAEIAAAKDPILSALARWARTATLTKAELAQQAGTM
ncbi:MAG: hypothetical protein IPL90_01455 [Holophagales bacterium]|nr:hypothetical protein [Holophagales bacterium]